MHQQPTTTAEVPRAYRVFIADDHPTVCHGLVGLLRREPDLEVCGHAGGVVEAVAAIRKTMPHVIVVDIELKDGSGLDLISSVKTWRRSVRALVWSVYDDHIYAERALRAGATGYINKQQSYQEIVQAMRCVLRGEVYLAPATSNRLLARINGSARLDDDPIQTLSDRELEVFTLIGHGLTVRQIAGRIYLSPKTVESHRERIRDKLGLRNSAQLQEQAVRWLMANV